MISHDAMHKIQNECEMSDNKMKFLASVLRDECGRNIIEPGYNEEIKEYGKAASDKYMEVIEVIMKVKNPNGNDYIEEKRDLVFCNDIDKVNPSLKVLFKNQFFIEQLYESTNFEVQYFKSWIDLLVCGRIKRGAWH